MLVKLPRTPGRKDAEFMHLFCGPVDVEAHAERAAQASKSEPTGRASVTELEERVRVLEQEVAQLKSKLE